MLYLRQKDLQDVAETWEEKKIKIPNNGAIWNKEREKWSDKKTQLMRNMEWNYGEIWKKELTSPKNSVIIQNSRWK